MVERVMQVKEDAPAKQPLYFKNPWPVDSRRHVTAGIRKHVGFDFTRDANAIPVTLHEFVEVARSYPIVFTLEETPMPVAVLGLRKRNQFVDSEGQWKKGHHVPHYVRKYPFALMEMQDKQQYILCIDEGSPHFQAEKPDLPLYDGSEAGPASKEALEICRRYHSDYLVTKQFAEAIKEAGLLESKELQAELPNGERVNVGGFQLISEEKWVALDDKKFLKWRENNWIGLIYVIMASQTNWKYLGQMEAG